MKVLVTGGAGYIGSHACKALARSGHKPITYDNLIYGHEWAVKWGPLERGNILDRERLCAVLRAHRPDAVMHFAAFAYVGESVEDPAKYYRNNVSGALSLLDAMRDCGVQQMIFSSTCATYGTPKSIPISESQVQAPDNPYGRSKLMIEQVLRDYGQAYGLQSIALRYFNAAGADPDGDLGEEHEPETHLIPVILQVAAGVRNHVTIFGENYETPDGTCIRDYVHVADLAHAHVLALEALAGPVKTRAYNLGTGRGFSVRDIICAANEITGRKIRVERGRRRPGDPAALIADAMCVRRDLGWIPHHSDLHVILATAWQWMTRRTVAHDS
jgi:UDP-arabinose 4-epimerase